MEVKIVISGNTSNPEVSVFIDECTLKVNDAPIEFPDEGTFRFIKSNFSDQAYVNADIMKKDLLYLLREDGTVNNVSSHLETIMNKLKEEITEIKENVVGFGMSEYVYNIDI